jgi:hypothetical protein
MVLDEIVRTCSNVHVANAALAAIGGAFAKGFAADASRRNLPPGMLASLVVKEFSATASPAQRADVSAAARGGEQPVLSGLRHILAQFLMSG